jgi:LysM repeat protein
MLPFGKWLHASGGDCRQMEMDAKRIFHVILVTLVPFSSALAQGAADSAKTEALALKAETIELEGLKTEIKAQGEKIDRLTQEVATLSDLLKQKSAPTVAKAEPVPSATPAATNPAAANPAVASPPTGTAGVENPAPADSAGVKTHTVAKGETLTQISKQYGVSVEEIEQLNKIGDAKKLQAGQTIKIPASQAASPSPAP